MQHIQHILHNLGHGIALQEAVVFKERVKNRLGDKMLRQHLYRIFFANAGIQVVAQPIKEGFKLRCNLRLLNQYLNFCNMAGGDLCNILCPCLPILTASTLLYDFA